jgi:RNA polymerase sigma factor (sigma-70 family)
MRKCKWTKGQISLLVRSARVAFDPDADPAQREAARWVADELAREFLPDANRLLWRFSTRLAIDADDRESIAHDAILDTIRVFDDVKHPDVCFTTVLTWRVRSSLSRHMRSFTSRNRETHRDNYVPIEDYAVAVDANDNEVDGVDAVVATLGRWKRSGQEQRRRHANIMKLRYWDGLTFPEIGRRIGMSKQGAQQAHNLALVGLRAAIS